MSPGFHQRSVPLLDLPASAKWRAWPPTVCRPKEPNRPSAPSTQGAKHYVFLDSPCPELARYLTSSAVELNQERVLMVRQCRLPNNTYILIDISNALIQSMRKLFYGDSCRGDIVPVQHLPGRLKHVPRCIHTCAHARTHAPTQLDEGYQNKRIATLPVLLFYFKWLAILSSPFMFSVRV